VKIEEKEDTRENKNHDLKKKKKNSILKSHGQGVVEKEAAGYFLLFQKSYPDDNR